MSYGGESHDPERGCGLLVLVPLVIALWLAVFIAAWTIATIIERVF